MIKENKIKWIVHNCILLFIFITIFSCSLFKPYNEIYLKNALIFNKDLSKEIYTNVSVWNNITAYKIKELYWGEPPSDSNDLNPCFKLILDSNNVYFKVEVIDDIKYLHPIPNDSIERTLWNHNDYDQIEIVLLNNPLGNLKFNYGIDSVFGIPEIAKNIKFLQEEDSNSYTLIIQIPWEITGLKFSQYKQLQYDVMIYDNDRKFDKDDIDIFCKWETYLGFGE